MAVWGVLLVPVLNTWATIININLFGGETWVSRTNHRHIGCEEDTHCSHTRYLCHRGHEHLDCDVEPPQSNDRSVNDIHSAEFIRAHDNAQTRSLQLLHINAELEKKYEASPAQRVVFLCLWLASVFVCLQHPLIMAHYVSNQVFCFWFNEAQLHVTCIQMCHLVICSTCLMPSLMNKRCQRIVHMSERQHPRKN